MSNRPSPSPKVSPGATMRAWHQERFAPLSAITPRELPVPEPGPGQVRVRVEAAGVDPSIWHLLTGDPRMTRVVFARRGRPKWPVPGSDLAGVVDAVGADVADLTVGDRVFGQGRGTFAPFTLAAATDLAIRPSAISATDAAALPVSGVTALEAVARARVGPGSRVAVTGAGGGVGSFVVQLAAHAGAEVTGVCSASKAEFVRGLGAAEVLDYRTADLLDLPPVPSGRFDAIIDLAGRRSILAVRPLLTRKGVLVVVGGESRRTELIGAGRMLAAGALSPFVPQTMVGLVAGMGRESLESLAALVESGAVRVPVARVVPFEEAVAAIEEVRAGRVAGKLVVSVAGADGG